MKIIDQTPFLSEGGEISKLDQIKATMKYGADWLQEINAQKTVIACFGRVLDNSFTLLRNVRLASLDINIPLILVGPAGIYALYATPLRGMFQAKGDSWGTLVGNTFKPARVNLIVRTAQMGRALQIYLERQGYPSLTPVEAVLLASDPGLHIDSVRPIVRVVMRDGLEHFAASVVQGRAVFSAETVHDILNRITTPPAASPEQPIAQGVSAPPFAQQADAFSLDTTQDSAARQIPARGGVHFPESGAFAESLASLQPEIIARRKKLSFSTKQWAYLIAFFVIEIIILVLFVALIVSNL
jgi:hypothetical protein